MLVQRIYKLGNYAAANQHLRKMCYKEKVRLIMDKYILWCALSFLAGIVISLNPFVLDFLLITPPKDFSKSWLKILLDTFLPLLAVILAVEYALIKIDKKTLGENFGQLKANKIINLRAKFQELSNLYDGKGNADWPPFNEGEPLINNLIDEITDEVTSLDKSYLDSTNLFLDEIAKIDGGDSNDYIAAASKLKIIGELINKL